MVALFDDPILANSALDRFAHRAHQIVMEGPSLRAASVPSAPKGKRYGSPRHRRAWRRSTRSRKDLLRPR